MINLGDYLGQLVSEITIARAQADLEAIRIAEMYANHELLKHFPAPRLRLQKVDFDIPIVVQKTDEVPKEGSPRGGLKMEEMIEHYTKVFEQQIRNYNLKLDGNDIENVFSIIKKSIIELFVPDYVSVDTNFAADKVTYDVGKYLYSKKEDLGEDKVRIFLEALKKSSRIEFINSKTQVPRIQVGVTSGEIKEAPQESIVHISVSIYEDAVEWTNIASTQDDKDDYRLVPE